MSKRERKDSFVGDKPKKRRHDKKDRVDTEGSIIEALEENDLKRARAMLLRAIKPSVMPRYEENDSDTELHLGAWFGSSEIVTLLIRKGADVNAGVNENVDTPLHFAAKNGHVDVVKVLIENGADVNAVAQEHKWTALHYASTYGDVDIVKVLIENGADVNAVTEHNWTALGIAIEQADLWNNRCALQLLCLGAEIDEFTIALDVNDFIEPIENRLKLLRNGNRIGTSLMSDEERHFMWNLAFSLTIQHRVAAFKTYYAIRSFITFHGIFMASGYELGEDSIWNDEWDYEWDSECDSVVRSFVRTEMKQ